MIDDLLAWRGTFSVSRGAGDIPNQYNRDVTYTNTDRNGQFHFEKVCDGTHVVQLDLESLPPDTEVSQMRSPSTDGNCVQAQR